MKNIIEKVLKLIDENKSQINIALKEEGREYDFDIQKVKTIINSFSNKKIEVKHNKNIVITNGNPYTTVYALMKSNLEENKTVFCTSEKLEKLNKELVRIFNQVNEKQLISFRNGIRLRDLYLTIEKRQETLLDVYDNFDYYYNLLTCGFNAHYNALFSIDLYYDSVEYEDMVEVIEDYAESRRNRSDSYQVHGENRKLPCQKFRVLQTLQGFREKRQKALPLLLRFRKRQNAGLYPVQRHKAYRQRPQMQRLQRERHTFRSRDQGVSQRPPVLREFQEEPRKDNPDLSSLPCCAGHLCAHFFRLRLYRLSTDKELARLHLTHRWSLRRILRAGLPQQDEQGVLPTPIHQDHYFNCRYCALDCSGRHTRSRYRTILLD